MKVIGYIFISLLLFILFVCLSRIRLCLTFDGNLRASIKFHFIKFNFYIPVLYRPKKSVQDDEYIYTPKEEKTKPQKTKKVKKEEKLSFPGIKNALMFFKDAVVDILGTVINSFRLEKLYFKAIVASNDAAKTAEIYGIVCTISASLHQLSTNAKKIKKNAVYIEARPDFLAETIDIYADINISIRIFRLLLIAKKALSAYFGYKKLCKKVMEEKAAESS